MYGKKYYIQVGNLYDNNFMEMGGLWRRRAGIVAVFCCMSGSSRVFGLSEGVLGRFCSKNFKTI